MRSVGGNSHVTPLLCKPDSGKAVLWWGLFCPKYTYTYIYICYIYVYLYICVCPTIHEYSPLLVQVVFWFLKLSPSSLAGIEQDAVNTFTKYISPDAAKPIPITEAMRNDIIGK